MGNEPRYVLDMVNFGGQFDHQKLYDAVQSMDVNTVGSLARTWTKLGEDAGNNVADFAAEIVRILDSGWQGSAATAARISFEAYGKTAPQLTESIAAVATPLESVMSAIQTLKAEMPEVQPLNWYDNATPWHSDMDVEHYQRRDEAFDSLRKHYPPAVQIVDTSIPVFTPLKESVVFPDTGGVGGPGGGSGGGRGGGGQGAGLDTALGRDPSLGEETGAFGESGFGESGLPTQNPASGIPSLGDAASTAAASAGPMASPTALGDGSRGPSGIGAGSGGGVGGGGGIGSGSGGLTGATPGGVASGPGGAGAGTGARPGGSAAVRRNARRRNGGRWRGWTRRWRQRRQGA